MAHLLRALVVPVEGPDLAPRTYRATHNPVPGNVTASSGPL